MRVHPITKAGAILMAVRLTGVAVRYLVVPAGTLVARVGIFVPAALFHLGVLLVIVTTFVAAASRASALRTVASVAACAVFIVLMIAGQTDLIVSSITGEPLTPTVFRTFRGFEILTSTEFLDPVRQHAVLALAGGGVLSVALAAMAFFVWSDMRRPVPAPTGRQQLAGAGCAALLILLGAGAGAVRPSAPPPIEAAFAREYLGLDQVRPSRPEPDAIDSLRAMLGLPPGARWLSDDYPLVYGPIDGAVRSLQPPADRPDIVVVVVESLRAAALGFVQGARADGTTPNLDALAARGVVFPSYISNAFPTAPAIMAVHCGCWPHRRKEILTDFRDRTFDILPSRLRDAGYETVFVGADAHIDKQHLVLSRWYDRSVDMIGLGKFPTDRNTVRHAIEEIRRHDREAGGRPLFELVSTLSTHYPFRVPYEHLETAADDRVEARYRRALRYADDQLGLLLEALGARARRDRTVTIVVGDHAFYVDLARASGMPENDNIWTGAIVAGPRDLVGEARRIVEPASHADLMPTILAFAGDRRPSASLGADLFGPPRGEMRSALAVRPGGLRLDRGGYSLLVDARRPNEVLSQPSFPVPALKPSGPAPTIEPLALDDWVAEWSRLVERDRVWSGAFLRPPRQL